MWKNSTGSNWIDISSCLAYSYNWWRYLDKIKGKVVFNNYQYSTTTARHQGECRQMLYYHRINIDLEVSIHNGLQNFKRDAIPSIYWEILDLEYLINKKGTRKSTNIERAEKIIMLKERIKLCRKLGAVLSNSDKAKMRRDYTTYRRV